MTPRDATPTTWRVSARTNGASTCVEARVFTDVEWRTSARTNGATTCVEAGVVPADDRWRTSHRSNSANACVEATATETVVAVRNSTDRSGPVLVVPAGGWLAFLDTVRTGAADYPTLGPDAAHGPFTITRADDGLVEVTLTGDPDAPTVRYTRPEWDVFTAGVTLDGEFTLDWLLQEPTPA